MRIEYTSKATQIQANSAARKKSRQGFLLSFFASFRLCVRISLRSQITPEFEGFLVNADMGIWLDHFMDRLPKGEVNKRGALDREVYVRKQGHYLFPADGAPR